MKSSAELKAEYEALCEKMAPLNQRRRELERQIAAAMSREFIAMHDITSDDVERSDGVRKPYFHTLEQFGKWLKQNSQKRFCEWNIQLYFTAEIIAGEFNRETPGRIDELYAP